MKREIKFRAWIYSLNKMVYIGSHKNDTSLVLSEDFYEVIDHFTGKIESIGDSDEGTILMQYTGLKDNNGKEIYEGDILNQVDLDGKDKDEKIVVIVFEYGMFCSTDNYPLHIEVEFDAKVIGNIYENPELIADQDKKHNYFL